MGDGTEPIADDEVIFRRVPPSACPDGMPDHTAFLPHKTRDVTGLSVSRQKYKSKEQAAQGMGPQYYVVELFAVKLREAGIEIEPRPLPADPGHAELPQLRAENYRETETQERAMVLAKMAVGHTYGPFPKLEQN